MSFPKTLQFFMKLDIEGMDIEVIESFSQDKWLSNYDKGKIISTDRINKSYNNLNFSKNIYIELKIDILNFKIFFNNKSQKKVSYNSNALGIPIIIILGSGIIS